MENLKYNTNQKPLTFYFNGNIDSSNSEQIGAELFEVFPLEGEVYFDFENVEYISSAGLRVILKAGKLNSKLQIINVKSNVFEIFEMTGFVEILNIKKAYREISIEGKEIIGQGYCGKIYRIDPDTICKVYYRAEGASIFEDMNYEIMLAKKAFVFGIPTAIPFDIVKIKEGGYGTVFELLKSKGFNKLFIEDHGNKEKYINLYIKLLKTIRNIEIDDPSLPSKKQHSFTWLERLEKTKFFDEPILKKLRHLLEEIPESKHLVHGDLHVKNIMMQGDEPIVIDMLTLGVGHPIFEYVAMYLTYIGYGSTDKNNCLEFLGIPNDECEELYYRLVNGVFDDKTEEERKDIITKCRLLGYMWLASKTLNHEPDNLVRLNHCKEEVLSLIDKVDTLVF